MAQRHKARTPRQSSADRALREQEVLRANRELAAYFRGRRTEREARAALKIIKAFVRDRERLDEAGRTPLPGASVARPAADGSTRLQVGGTERHSGRPTRKPRRTPPKMVSARVDPPVESERAALSDPAKQKPE
jgi:hypothetical protein